MYAPHITPWNIDVQISDEDNVQVFVCGWQIPWAEEFSKDMLVAAWQILPEGTPDFEIRGYATDSIARMLAAEWPRLWRDHVSDEEKRRIVAALYSSAA